LRPRRGPKGDPSTKFSSPGKAPGADKNDEKKNSTFEKKKRSMAPIWVGVKGAQKRRPTACGSAEHEKKSCQKTLKKKKRPTTPNHGKEEVNQRKVIHETNEVKNLVCLDDLRHLWG